MKRVIVKKDEGFSKGYRNAIENIQSIINEEINEMKLLNSNWQQGIFICKDILKKLRALQ